MRRPILLATLLFLLAPGLAAAADAFTTGSVNLRTGPGTGYPVVATLPPGAPVEVYGCVSGWSWCDTRWGGSRGWVAGGYLQIVYNGAPVPFVAYAPRVAVSVVVYTPPVAIARPWAAPRRVTVGPNHACYRGPHVVGCR